MATKAEKLERARAGPHKEAVDVYGSTVRNAPTDTQRQLHVDDDGNLGVVTTQPVNIIIGIHSDFLSDVDCTRRLGDRTLIPPRRWRGADFCGDVYIQNVANQDALVIGGPAEEGGDIVVYADAVGNPAFILDADAMLDPGADVIVTVGDPDIDNLAIGPDITLRIYGHDGTALSLGDPTHEGGDIIVYEDATGNISFQVDADAADVTIGDPDTELGLLTIYGNDATVLQLGDATHEGGDVVVYEDAVGNIAFSLDADIASMVLGDPDTELGDFTIYGNDGTVLQLGDATHEGGDIIVYEDGAGNISFEVDADNALLSPTLRLGNTTSQKGMLEVHSVDLTIASRDKAIRVFGDYGALAPGWECETYIGSTMPGLGAAYPFVALRHDDSVNDQTWTLYFVAGVVGQFVMDGAGVSTFNFFTDGTLGHSLIPAIDSTFNIGSATNYWIMGYFDGITVGPGVAGPVGTHINARVDNRSDIGTAVVEFRNLYLDGWAYIDSLRIDVALDVSPIDGAGVGAAVYLTAIPVTTSLGPGFIYVYVNAQGTPVQDRTVAIKINGTVYYLLASTVAVQNGEI